MCSGFDVDLRGLGLDFFTYNKWSYGSNGSVGVSPTHEAYVREMTLRTFQSKSYLMTCVP